MAAPRSSRPTVRPLPRSGDEWLHEIADAYGDAYETLPFMLFAGVEPGEKELFHLAPRIAVKFRGLPRSQEDTAVEAALSSYVASKEQAGEALADPHLAFAFCYLAGHFGLGLLSQQAVNEVMDFLEENKVFLSDAITQVNCRAGT